MDGVPPSKVAPFFEKIYCCKFSPAVYFAQVMVGSGTVG